MNDYSWQFVAVFSVVVAAVVIMFAITDDQSMREHLINYMDAIVPFIVGGVAGGAVGFAKGKKVGFAMGKGVT